MPVPYIFRPNAADAEYAEQIRELIKASREVLQQPKPDSFLGRKTQEPFRKEDGE